MHIQTRTPELWAEVMMRAMDASSWSLLCPNARSLVPMHMTRSVRLGSASRAFARSSPEAVANMPVRVRALPPTPALTTSAPLAVRTSVQRG